MLRSIKELIGCRLLTTDGEYAKIEDFFFNHEDWTIPYLMVSTGPWIFGRRVLIPTAKFGSPDWRSTLSSVNTWY
ncbi:PRC-barrel domain-containing protein [Chloroflexota bacterium]